jgi:hypothetical protein
VEVLLHRLGQIREVVPELDVVLILSGRFQEMVKVPDPVQFVAHDNAGAIEKILQAT